MSQTYDQVHDHKCQPVFIYFSSFLHVAAIQTWTTPCIQTLSYFTIICSKLLITMYSRQGRTPCWVGVYGLRPLWSALK
jgi:hypothetical protein